MNFVTTVNYGLRFGGGYEVTMCIPILEIERIEPIVFEDPCKDETEETAMHCEVLTKSGRKYYSEESIEEFLKRNLTGSELKTPNPS
jgi:hypothetical protein